MNHAENDMPRAEDFDRVCGNCDGCFPFEKYILSDDIVCLWDPEFEPHLDDILADESLDCCLELAKRKMMPMDHEPCAKFEMCGFDDTQHISINPDNLDVAQIDLIIKIAKENSSKKKLDNEMARLSKANTSEERIKAVKTLGHYVEMSHNGAFIALADYLRNLQPPSDIGDVHVRLKLLECLSKARGKEAETAALVVDDLIKIPSNNTSRTYYTSVFNYFTRNNWENASELEKLLDRPGCSAKLRRKMLEVVEDCNRKGPFNC